MIQKVALAFSALEGFKGNFGKSFADTSLELFVRVPWLWVWFEALIPVVKVTIDWKISSSLNLAWDKGRAAAMKLQSLSSELSRHQKTIDS